ncbi:hypothetical protein [Treponema primitia]|uniref:hypothetical protein n=1 Tax=Treponema primitia TaxID=88058 RepID=UPI000255535D|nr:hypothetical protein [Treponema primitia]
MPWRLLGLVLILVIFLAFIGLNLDNRCIISFGFWATKEPVPVFLPIFASFVFGLLCSIPFAVSIGFKRSKKNKAGNSGGVLPGQFPAPGKKRGKGDPSPEDFPIGGPYDID